MAVIHIGTATTLASVPIADCSNGDVSYIWLNEYQRKMVFFSTATDVANTTDHPYYVRPSDYSTAGVWVEDVGADQPEAWSADQVVTGNLMSTNYSLATGSAYSLDGAYFKLGGSNVDAAGAANGVFLGLDSSLYKVYIGDGSDQYFKYDGTNISWSSANSSLSTSGILYATGASISGSMSVTTGDIGGWTLATGNLHSTNIYLNSADEKITINNATFGNAGIQLDYNGGSPQTYIGDGANQYLRYTTVDGLSWRGTNASLSTAGVLSVSNILLTGGTAAGFTVSDSEGFYVGSGATRVQMKGGVGIWSGATAFVDAPFRVNNAGNLYASSATIAGNITANSGTVGGFTIDSAEGLYAGTGATRVQMKAGSGFWAGATAFDDAPFRVDQTGLLYATGASITGSVTATTGVIGGWTIASTQLNNTNLWLDAGNKQLAIGSQTFGAAGLQLEYNSGTPRVYFGDGSNAYFTFDGTKVMWKTANSQLNSDGTLTVSGSVIEGSFSVTDNSTIGGDMVIGTAGAIYTTGKTIYADDDAGFWLGYDGGKYKLYVGSATNNIKWDGTNLSWIGVNTSLDTSGNFSATAATITGVVTANTGYIGGTSGWTIAAGKMTASGIGVATSTGDATYAFWAGHDTPASAEFRVSHAGALVATSATITGSITASSGSISGSFTVGSTLIVNSSGKIYSTGKTSYADTTAGFFLGYDTVTTSAYKFSIGDGNRYIKYDGSNLTISVDANSGGSEGVIYKNGVRWLYDFNPAHNGTVKPAGYNTFLGYGCGNLTMGSTATYSWEASYNVGIGYYSLDANTKGAYSVGIGFHALGSNTEGSNNNAVGYYALGLNTTGVQNSAFGFYALKANTIGVNNTAVGDAALYFATTADNNTALGMHALYGLTTGEENIGIGVDAGTFQSNGSSVLETPEDSIYIGNFTKSGSDASGGEDAIDNEIVIGYNATGNGSDSIKLGNTSISALNCQVALTVDSDRRIKRNIVESSLGLDFVNQLSPVTFQQKNPMDYPDNIKPSNFKDRMIKRPEKNASKAHKEKLQKADKRPRDNDRVYLGLIAQDVEEVLEDLGLPFDFVSTNRDGKKAITYESLIMPLITAVQELTARIETLEGGS